MSTSDRPYHHGDLLAALLSAAETLLDEGGDGALSLREVARRAGVSPAAAYRHVPDKEALLARLAARGFAAFGEALGRAAAEAPGSALDAMGVAYVEFALARPARFRLMFGPLTARATDEVLGAARREAFAVLSGVAGSRAASLRAWGLVHGLAMLLLDGALPSDDPVALVKEVLGVTGA
ncbi:TetR/AcrR family transcriptional regulator [Roseomonas nepalensis]|uniref:TetR/AcrR family transcriptional regulator n=1 Tax=Muricoccus nepalensis TaxID=1854500 RepID=A0A502FG43_9PROT|nr:TetR/AcrR family transcriptional regulator [Roseomonas nepalensis]TPG48398.1 TetR/AcrR family transcriptional regulator [Roseomonas nepalensis]